MNGKIESDKTLIRNLLYNFWFRIPEYQRSYVWTTDEVSELISDINYASENHPNNEYFLGSIVMQKRIVSASNAAGSTFEYIEHDLLDGQQRLTTTFMMLAVIRDITSKVQIKETCSEFIYQKENEFKEIPERLRIVYKIRDAVETFVHSFIKEEGGTLKKRELDEHAELKNVSISHMARAIRFMHKHFTEVSEIDLERFSKFLFNNVLVIYVSSENLEDAFRLFTILNDRGLPLTNSDILKAWNLGATKENDKDRYAQLWEDLEGSFGRDEFERLLSIIRTIYVKEKARENLLKEFEEKIYGAKPPMLKKGKPTFEAIKEYATIYDQLIFFEDTPKAVPNEFKNLIRIMVAGLPSNDWIPSLLAFYKKFGPNDLLNFTIKLDNKFSADWILQETPTGRITNMGGILKAIEKSKTAQELFGNADAFGFYNDELEDYLGEAIYRKRYGKYVLLKLEYLHQDHSHVFSNFEQVSVEHVLPQNPEDGSQWLIDFDDEDVRNAWVHCIGNLILISRKKNASLNRREFVDKKQTYFSNYVSVFPNSVRIMNYDEWTPENLFERQKELIDELVEHYKR